MRATLVDMSRKKAAVKPVPPPVPPQPSGGSSRTRTPSAKRFHFEQVTETASQARSQAKKAKEHERRQGDGAMLATNAIRQCVRPRQRGNVCDQDNEAIKIEVGRDGREEELGSGKIGGRQMFPNECQGFVFCKKQANSWHPFENCLPPPTFPSIERALLTTLYGKPWLQRSCI